jgi:transcriptional antiterminator NusG
VVETPAPLPAVSVEEPTPPPAPAVAEEVAPAPIEPAVVETPAPPPAEPPAAAAPPAAPEVPAEPARKAAAVRIEEAPPPAAEPPPPPSNKHWYVVKVQSGREESIKDSIERRVKIEGLEEFFGQIVIPVEKVTEMRNGKRVTKEHKLYPGYLMAEVEFNDRILYLFRETSGVGDFVGATATRPPQPMSQREVDRMLHKKPAEEAAKVAKPKFDKGDRLRVKDGIFSGMEGEVKELLEAKSALRLELTIFGRPTSVELEYWQVEPV